MNDKRILIIAGPNGAGKTTFAQEFLPGEAGCTIFVNADLIAAGLSPFTPELAAMRAGRIMLDQIHEHADSGNGDCAGAPARGGGWAQCAGGRDSAAFSCRTAQFQAGLQAAG